MKYRTICGKFTPVCVGFRIYFQPRQPAWSSNNVLHGWKRANSYHWLGSFMLHKVLSGGKFNYHTHIDVLEIGTSNEWPINYHQCIIFLMGSLMLLWYRRKLLFLSSIFIFCEMLFVEKNSITTPRIDIRKIGTPLFLKDDFLNILINIIQCFIHQDQNQCPTKAGAPGAPPADSSGPCRQVK